MEVSQWQKISLGVVKTEWGQKLLAKSQRLVLALADGFTIDLQPNNTSTNSNYEYKNKAQLLLQL